MKKIAVFFLVLPLAAVLAKGKKEYIEDLKSPQDEVVIAAAQYLGNDEVKDAIEPLGEVVKSNRSAGVRIAAASALGKMDKKGRPTTILREAIEADQDNHVIYTQLLALLNLKDTENPDLLKAIEYCEANKSNDVFIKDIITRIRKIVPQKK